MVKANAVEKMGWTQVPGVQQSYPPNARLSEQEGWVEDDETVERIAAARTKDELKSGVQTIQYQINTLMTTNGQSPFVTLFLNLQEDDPYLEENAMIVEEVLRQRLEGIAEGDADGVHGDVSVQNTLWLQNLAQLEETGVMDRQTWDMLSRLYELFITAEPLP